MQGAQHPDYRGCRRRAPPKQNIHRYLDMGASFVVFSGGKELRGPQASGLILGFRDGIEACSLNCCPNYGIGRCMKIDKENICGLVKAVELFAQKDYDRQMEIWSGYTHKLYELLSACPDLELTLGYPQEPGVQPACILRLFVFTQSRHNLIRLKQSPPAFDQPGETVSVIAEYASSPAGASIVQTISFGSSRKVRE